MGSEQAGLTGSLRSQDENMDAGRPNDHNNYRSTMPDISFNDPRRPPLALKDEINLLAARTYVCSRLFDTEQNNKSPQSDLEYPKAETSNEGESKRRSRKDEGIPFPEIPRPCLKSVPDLTCKELDVVYHALIRANSRHQGTEANRDPSLVRALNAIRKRLNMEEARINLQG